MAKGTGIRKGYDQEAKHGLVRAYLWKKTHLNWAVGGGYAGMAELLKCLLCVLQR